MNTSVDLQMQESYINKMLNEGVYVFKNRITNRHIQAIKKEICHIHQIVMSKIANMARPLKIYSDISERQLNRLDYRCGFISDIFNEVAAPIVDIVKNISPKIDFRYYWGAIPALAHAGPTDMHRDIYSILNTTEGMNLDVLDLNLPPYYFTVLIPLVEITKENGPTEFIKCSHRHAIVDEDKAEIYAPLLSPGDFVIFEGRTMHRGSANNTEDDRLIAYITFVANWYHDQTFVINDYLFPELLTHGR